MVSLDYCLFRKKAGRANNYEVYTLHPSHVDSLAICNFHAHALSFPYFPLPQIKQDEFRKIASKLLLLDEVADSLFQVKAVSSYFWDIFFVGFTSWHIFIFFISPVCCPGLSAQMHVHMYKKVEETWARARVHSWWARTRSRVACARAGAGRGQERQHRPDGAHVGAHVPGPPSALLQNSRPGPQR